MKLLKDLVEKHITSAAQKAITNGFIIRAEEEQEKRRRDRELIETIAGEQKISEVVLSTAEVKIFTVYGKDEWDIKYPFRSIYLNEKGKWERVDTVSSSLDTAFLVYLERKQLGANSQFADFAMKMLEIKSPND